MKDGIREIVGKTISEVVVTQNSRQPMCQVFLVFTDGKYFELWGDLISGAGGLDRGDAQAAIDYATSFGAEVAKRFPDSS